MKKSIGIQLIIYSLLLVGLGYLAYNLAPPFGRTTLITSVAGGSLCVIWGLWTLSGSQRRAPAILTLVPVNFVLLSQTVTGFMGEHSSVSGHRAATAVITLAFILSTAMIMRLAYASAQSVYPPNAGAARNPPAAAQPKQQPNQFARR